MNMSENTVFKKIKKGDVLASFIVILFAVMIFLFMSFSSKTADTVNITYGTHTFSYPLYEDRVMNIENNGVRCQVTVEDGYVWVSQTDCKEKICADTGKISSGCIICAPGGIVIYISGGEHDVVAG